MKGTLSRFAYLADCTLGWLEFGNLRLATLERPWIVNPKGQGGMPRLSCVPDGQYRLMPHSSEKFPETFCLANELLGVYPAALPAGQAWGRTAVLIHSGNTAADVVGCVIVGTKHSFWDATHCILESRVALDRLRTCLGRTNHTLQIMPTPGTR